MSFEDNLLRLFGSPKLREMMVNNIEGEEAIEARIISRSIENAQRKVEGHNFEIRKILLPDVFILKNVMCLMTNARLFINSASS